MGNISRYNQSLCMNETPLSKPYDLFFSSPVPFPLPALSVGTNLRAWLNIQNLDLTPSGPSLRNSWPSPFPQRPHVSLSAVLLLLDCGSSSLALASESWCRGWEKA